MPAKPASAPVDEMSFEAALKELESIVSRLEQGEVDLEDSIVGGAPEDLIRELTMCWIFGS